MSSLVGKINMEQNMFNDGTNHIIFWIKTKKEKDWGIETAYPVDMTQRLGSCVSVDVLRHIQKWTDMGIKYRMFN